MLWNDLKCSVLILCWLKQKISSREFGLETGEIDYAKAFKKSMERMRKLRASIAEHDSPYRLRSLGIDVFLGSAQFIDDHSLQVTRAGNESQVLRFKRCSIATGSTPFIPEIPGLKEAGKEVT